MTKEFDHSYTSTKIVKKKKKKKLWLKVYLLTLPSGLYNLLGLYEISWVFRTLWAWETALDSSSWSDKLQNFHQRENIKEMNGQFLCISSIALGNAMY